VRNRTIWKKIASAGGGHDWVIVGFEKLVERTKKREITEDGSADADMAGKVPVDMPVVSEQVGIKQGGMNGQEPMIACEDIRLDFPKTLSSAERVDGSTSLFGQNHDLAESDKLRRRMSVKGVDDVALGLIKNKILSRMIVTVANRPTDVMTRKRSSTSSSSIQKEPYPADTSSSTTVSTTPYPRRRAILHQAISDKASQLKPVAAPTSKILKPSHSRPRPSIGAIKRILAHDLGVKIPMSCRKDHQMTVGNTCL
jgi:hypothetical protein